ncbi:MAG: YndJ family transporter [Prosthecobacter sp.]|uniref:YndJ family transporter n=1 Tax=Prosthecobacter sp. TaxID=1965333 RepID=UPI0038FE1D87
MNKLDPKAWIKPLIWLAVVAMLKARAVESSWVVILLLFSPLVLMPLWFGESAKLWRRKFDEAAVIVLAGSFLREPGWEAVLFAVPWLVVRVLAASDVAMEWRKNGVPSLATGCVHAASVFPAIGAAWLAAQRANWTPFGFDPLIVLLTAAHFHHAGFTLPLMAGLNAKARPGALTKFSCVAILAGVPLVAVGITCTHFGVLKFVEPFGVAILVLGALGVAVSQMRRGLEREWSLWTRAGFLISGASLFAAMVLAMSFGLRYVFPQLALTMPQMWAIHGTLNAFGFGLCGILAWRSVGLRNTRNTRNA